MRSNNPLFTGGFGYGTPKRSKKHYRSGDEHEDLRLIFLDLSQEDAAKKEIRAAGPYAKNDRAGTDRLDSSR
jgi:hypothetical protein